MKLTRRIDQALVVAMALILVLFFGCLIKMHSVATFAEGEEGTFVSAEAKYVTFYDNGNKLTVKTEAKTVAEALQRAKITINTGDKVEPALDTEIDMDNFFVNIYRARPVVVKDGVTEKYLMTASYDARAIAAEAELTIYDDDKIDLVPNADFLEAGAVAVYQVTRTGGRTLTVEEEIPFGEETVRDYNMAAGESEVRQLGEVGMKRTIYQIFYIDGVEQSRELVSEEVVREPVARIVATGAKKSIPPEWETCATWAREAGVSEADLSAALDLIYRESGCRVDATNASSGAYGIPQALPGSKMAAYGADWETNPVTQIRWMIGYVNGRYGGWSQALEYWYTHGWY